MALVIVPCPRPFTTAPLYNARHYYMYCYHFKPWGVLYGVLVVFGQTRAPRPPVDYVPARSSLPLSPSLYGYMYQKIRTAQYTLLFVRLCASLH